RRQHVRYCRKTEIDFDAEHHPGELRYQYAGGNTLVFGDVDGNGKADFSSALKGLVLLHDTDFVLQGGMSASGTKRTR
ncbi:MAG TPA: hypothetical protein VIG52_13250, partial [Methyloceanibacter sp.]